jgi:hypothetical protein
MAFKHSKDTVIMLGGNDISTYCNTSSLERSATSHDVTTYGKEAKVKQGGLLDGSCSVGGWYDDTAAGPHDVIQPMVGTVVELIRRPEGTGSGLPQQTVDVLVQNYVETDPIDDIIQWTASLELSDDLVKANQA